MQAKAPDTAKQFFFVSLVTLANLNSIPQSTILCNETWVRTFHIDLCELSFSWDLFVLFLPTALSISIVSMIFMSPYFFIALFFPAAHCDKNRGIHFFFLSVKRCLFYSNVFFMHKYFYTGVKLKRSSGSHLYMMREPMNISFFKLYQRIIEQKLKYMFSQPVPNRVRLLGSYMTPSCENC